MKAIVLREAGGPEALRVETVDDPVPGAGEVTVRVRTAALNHRDLFITRGQYAGLDAAVASTFPSCWVTTAWARWPRSGPASLVAVVALAWHGEGFVSEGAYIPLRSQREQDTVPLNSPVSADSSAFAENSASFRL